MWNFTSYVFLLLNIFYTIVISSAISSEDFRDKNFNGDILVVGGESFKNCQKLSINIQSPCDIWGNGWDISLINKLTSKKYSQVILNM